jgi:hypothetical protein
MVLPEIEQEVMRATSMAQATRSIVIGCVALLMGAIILGGTLVGAAVRDTNHDRDSAIMEAIVQAQYDACLRGLSLRSQVNTNSEIIRSVLSSVEGEFYERKAAEVRTLPQPDCERIRADLREALDK